MDYAAIKLATQVILGEVAEGSSTYADDQYQDAIQWSQEQISQILGLTYGETGVAVSGVTGPTGDVVGSVVIPNDAIEMIRVMIGATL